ncbi:ParA family protein (plasmid) [Acuticoccus sp. MNP-M23]|uniref:ParA family protein n=1 Tax=Acuticoccus sp. MNP-M23 TaxID=3072793 RepID=UPI0028152EA8|nr:ParA family protein [Acuticoccus sp. MNP-M23]WMS45331.1 ParA family protein [Acuticoccus sp. MNP-M23]
MGCIVGFVSQKGGVGKSTLARLLAREAAAGGLSVKIADVDIQQGTAYQWAKRRAENGFEPEIRIETFNNIKTALKEANQFDVYIFDGAPHASRDTLTIAKAANLIVIPTSQGRDDLDPSVLLGYDLLDAGISKDRIVYALVKVTDSDAEIAAARQYLEKAHFTVLQGELPVRTAYSQAHDVGRAVTEAPFPSLVKRADKLAQSLVDAVAARMQEVA